jgi:methylenetetrahydrofolate dehydrogenase (NADP+)/methenyltetrahydrofolate cyclohydrolase
MIGDSPPARLYAGRLEKLGHRVGIHVHREHLPSDVALEGLMDTITTLDEDSSVDGILVQMPLPMNLQGKDLSDVLSYRKDVDGVTVLNAGHLYLGVPGHYPPTAVAMMELLRESGVSASGRTAVVVGRSNVVGHPVAELLLHEDATVVVTHRQTRDLGAFTSQADILMVGAGEPHLVSGAMVKPGAVVIDAGINVTGTGIVGDVDPLTVEARAGALTPVPGGVGPVTNAILLRHVTDSAEAALD